MMYTEFKNKVKDTYAKYFPNSLCAIACRTALSQPYISIVLYLAKDSTECSGNYISNDMFRISFSIDMPKDFDKDADELPDTLTLENLHKEMLTAPVGYGAFGTVSIPFRKTSGNGTKLVKTFDKFFSKMLDTIKDLKDSDRIANSYISIVSDKIS